MNWKRIRGNLTILFIGTVAMIVVFLTLRFIGTINSSLKDKEYICRIDAFDGVPLCYEVEGRDCNEKEGSYLVSTPYSWNRKLDEPEESRLCIYPEQLHDLPDFDSLSWWGSRWFKTTGRIKLEGLHWNNLNEN